MLRTILLTFCMLLGLHGLRCQVYPVQVNVNVVPPHTTYLSDYFGAGSTKLNTSLSFNDANEASINVRFRVTLEGNGLKLQSNPNMAFRPYTIITGSQVIAADVIADYFNNSNMAFQGTSASELQRNNNRLPEGGYSLCIEVLEYTTGKVISNKACTYVFMQLSDEPIISIPSCGSVITQTAIQNINFQWQQSNAAGSGAPLEYQLTLYEVTDRTVNPLFAIRNNKAQLIFTSDWQLNTSFLYRDGEPVLTQGKIYAFRVQGRFQDGKALKNNGYSEPCYFYYGYPTGGLIPLKQPLDLMSFKDSDPLVFAWMRQNNILAGQQVSYKINVYKLSDDQSKEEAVLNNPVFYTQTYPNAIPAAEYQTLLQTRLDKKSSYVWQVQSYTGTVLTAESEIRTFAGPALIESFTAGEYTISVESTSNTDLNSLTGTGSFRVDSSGTVQKVVFSNLKIALVAGNFVLDAGNIIGNLSDTTPVRLSPMEATNGAAYFNPQKYHIYREGIKIQGYVSWALPHAVQHMGVAQVHSSPAWLQYNYYKLSGALNFAQGNNFNLLEPFGFRLELDPLSVFNVFLNKYHMTIHGEVVMPTLVKNTLTATTHVKLPFSDATQLHYFGNRNRKPQHRILPVQNLGIEIAPQEYVFDFSDRASPPKLQSDPTWKGVYLEKSNVVFKSEFDAHKQMFFNTETNYNMVLSATDSIYNHVDADGLTFTFKRKFNDGYNVKINTFPAFLTDFKIDVFRNTLQESHLNGSLYVPFVSTTQKFKFVCPVTTSGIRPGYLEGMDGLEFTFNPQKEREKLNIKISKAVFVNQERIDMSFDLKWPYLHLDFGNVNGFAIWGDYKIGFYSVNGTRLLEQQASGKYEDYEYAASKIGAGRNAGAYSIGIGGSISISTDIAGASGAPEVNFYSIQPNSMLPYEAEILQGEMQNMAGSAPGANPIANLSLSQRREIAGQELEKEYKASVATLADFHIPADQVLDLPIIPSDETLQLPQPYAASDTTGSTELIKGGLRAKLSDKEYKVLEQFVDAFIKLGYGIIGQKITRTTGKVNAKIDSVFNKGLKIADKFIDEKTHRLLDSLALKAVSTFKNKDTYDPTELVLQITDTIADEIALEIKRSVKVAVDKNLRVPIKTLIAVQIGDSLNQFMVRFLQTSAHRLMNGEITGEQIVQNFGDELPLQLEKSLKAILTFVKPKNLIKSCEKTCVDALKGIDMGRVASRLTNGLLSGSENSLKKAWENLAEGKINTLVVGAMADAPILNAIAGPTVQLNFNNLGEKIKKGDVAGIVSIDPTNISVNTKFVSFNGVLKNEKSDLYGNVWRANVSVQIKKPKPFSVDAIYLSGKIKGRDYWFCQVSPGNPEGTKPGGRMSKEPKPFTSPATIGPIQLVAGTGRIYKHMKEINRGQDIVPDSLTDFGAYLNLVAYDTPNSGKTMRLALEAEFILSEDDNYTVDFEGNVQLMSKVVSYNKIDENAAVKGTLTIHYSSAESHFIAHGTMEMVKPGTLCAYGSLRFESKPNYFSIDIGTRDELIRIIPSCNSWGGIGYMHADSYNAALGLGVGWYANAAARFSMGSIACAIGVNAGVELMLEAGFQHTPQFQLNFIGVWAHGFAEVYIDYKTPISSGHISLISIDVVLEGRVTINPKPSNLRGLAKGRACFLSFCVGFEAGFDKNI